MADRFEIELGAVTIALPTASDPKCSIFHDLAELFGVETNAEAREMFERAWSGGRLDLDHEAGGVMIRAGREAIVDAALLIHRLSVQELRPELGSDAIAKVRARVKAHRRPKPFRWEVGDVFAVPLADGSYAFGQVLWEQPLAPEGGLRAPTCALFEHHAPSPEVEVEEVLTSRTLAILHVASDHLDTQEWRVIGRAAPVNDPFSGPCGQPGRVGAISWDGLETLANAWFGLAPWNLAHRDDYLDRYLMRGVKRPARAILLGPEELARHGVRRSS